jgi:pimeloyl-ACP methyl ester carboxylesterase
MKRLLRPRILLPAAPTIVVAAYLLVAFMLVREATHTERKPFEQHPDDFNLRYEDVTFTPRGDDILLSGWFFPGESAAPYVIFVHGIDSQRTDAGAVDLAARLVRSEGYNVLIFDLRGHGTSEGDTITAGDRERHDVLGAYDYVLSRGAVPGGVGLIGRSYGAGIAIMAAALEPGIAAVVADSPFTSVEEKAAHEAALRTPLPEWLVPVFMPPARLFGSVLYGIDIGDLRPVRDVSKLAYPVLVIHGEADTRTPVSHGRRVYEAAPPGSELWTLPGAGHTRAFIDEPDEYERRVRKYLSERFRARGGAHGPSQHSARTFTEAARECPDARIPDHGARHALARDLPSRSAFWSI